MRADLKGTAAEGVVTDADLVALAGAFAVRLCGGPAIPLPIGRPVAAAARQDPPGRMPSENASAAELKANFAAKGLSVQEMVALSGEGERGRAREGGGRGRKGEEGGGRGRAWGMGEELGVGKGGGLCSSGPPSHPAKPHTPPAPS